MPYDSVESRRRETESGIKQSIDTKTELPETCGQRVFA